MFHGPWTERQCLPFIYSGNIYLALWWWFTNKQYVGCCVCLKKKVGSSGSDKAQPIPAGTNSFKKTSCQQQWNPESSPTSSAFWQSLRNLLLGFRSEMSGKWRNEATAEAFRQLRLNQEADGNVFMYCYYYYPSQIEKHRMIGASDPPKGVGCRVEMKKCSE